MVCCLIYLHQTRRGYNHQRGDEQISPLDLSHTRSVQYFVAIEVRTAVTMNSSGLWDIEIRFLPHRKHMRSPLQSSAG
jgi:hypothetical protein